MDTWSSKIDRITEDFTLAFGTLSVAQLQWKPNPQSWSIAENINHLIVVGESYYPTFEALKSDTYKPPFVAKLKFMVGLFGNIVLGAVQPDRKKKMKTFPIWQPTASAIDSDILEKFKKFQSELKRHLEDLSTKAKQGAVIASPAKKSIVYRLEVAFEIILTHEQRHFEQAKEVLAQL